MGFEFIPPGLFAFLYQLARENKLSTTEVKTAFLRHMCEKLGFKCQHDTIGHSKKTSLPFCKECWTRLEKKEDKVLEKGKLVKKIKYVPVETFLDRFLQGKSKVEFEEATKWMKTSKRSLSEKFHDPDRLQKKNTSL